MGSEFVWARRREESHLENWEWIFFFFWFQCLLYVTNKCSENKTIFLYNWRDGGSGAEEGVDLPQVDLRGRDLDQLLDMSYQQPMVAAAWNLQGRWHFLPTGLHKAPTEKPEVVKVHLQGVIILCETVGGTVGVHSVRHSTSWKSSLRCSTATWASTPSPTGPWTTVGLTSGSPTPSLSSPSSKVTDFPKNKQ